MNTLQKYLNLITSQHKQRPKYMAFVEASIKPLADLQVLLEEMRACFDLDTALGQQLDQVGLWVGRTRYLKTPLTGVYFTWDEAGVGWGEGAWKGKFDPSTGMHKLPDDIFRTLLKAKVAANHWDGTIPGAYKVWETAFADTGSILVIQDNQNMSMTVGIAGAPLNAVMEALLTQGYIPLKPAGVHIKWYAITPHGGPLFAWGCESNALNGWNIGSWPIKLEPKQEQ